MNLNLCKTIMENYLRVNFIIIIIVKNDFMKFEIKKPYINKKNNLKTTFMLIQLY